MTQETKQKILKTIELIAKTAVAIAAVWLALSCTMSMSISKNNTNSNQNTEQTNRLDSTNISVPRGTYKTK